MVWVFAGAHFILSIYLFHSISWMAAIFVRKHISGIRPLEFIDEYKKIFANNHLYCVSQQF